MSRPTAALLATLLRALLAAVTVVAAAPALAQYPQKPIRLIVPSPPGDGSDLMARAIGERLTAAWGQPVVVDNRQGAGGRVGTEAAAKAAPDGYTLIMGNAGSHGINAALYRDLGYDVEKDFVAITQVMRAPNVLVIHPALPAKNVAEFVALMKASPGKYSYGSGGNGSSAHFTAELFKAMSGTDIAHIPYKGATPALTDVIGGQVVMFMGNLPPAIGHIKAGRVRALAVTTAQRSPLVSDLPTVAETLPGFETVARFGLFAPAGTPRDIVQKIREEVARIVQQPEIRERIGTLGGEPVGNAPDEFAAIVRSDVEKWKRVAASAQIKAD